MIDIDKGIPIPAPRKSCSKYPVLDMEIGDSFAVDHAKGPDARQDLLNSIKCTAQYYKRKYKITLAVRNVTEDGVDRLRVWRVA